jgi:hypothetical protein
LLGILKDDAVVLKPLALVYSFVPDIEWNESEPKQDETNRCCNLNFRAVYEYYWHEGYY